MLVLAAGLLISHHSMAASLQPLPQPMLVFLKLWTRLPFFPPPGITRRSAFPVSQGHCLHYCS